MNSSMNSKVITELKRIERECGGVLQASAVVEAARPTESPLHSHFEWDDVKASNEYRLWQARQLIRVCVHVIDKSPNESDRIWVSLKSDRSSPGGLYRPTVSVLSDKALREQLLRDAIDEFDYFQKKFGQLKELVDVFRAMRKVAAQHSKK